MEKYLTIVVHGVPVIEFFMIGYCFCRLAGPFMENKKRKWNIGFTYALSMLILHLIPWNIDIFAGHGISVFAAFLAMCQADRKNYEQKAFLAVTFFSLHWFTFAMAEILYDNLYSFAEHTDYMTEHENMWFALYVAVCICYLVFEYVLTLISIWCITRAYTDKYVEMAKKELFMLSVPSFIGAVGYEVAHYYRSFYIKEAGKISNTYDILEFLYYAMSVGAIVTVIVLYQRIKANQEEKLQNELLAAQIDSIMHHITQVENLYQNIRSIRHDMTNHILTLESLYAGAEQSAAKAYAKELKAVLSNVQEEKKSGNPVTDVILQGWKNEAEKKEICFQCDFHYPVGGKINAFDLSIILNNGLQNALENTISRTKDNTESYISIRSYRRNNAYMIEIRNSFSGILQWDEQKKLPRTSKEKEDNQGYGQVHGYGLANIQKVAQKYCGDIDIVQKDGEFCLSILLMII